MYAFKKIVAPFLFPIPVCLELLIVGLILLWFTRRQRLGKLFVSAGTLLLFVLGYGVFSGRLLKPLEWRYPVAHIRAEPAEAAAGPCRIAVLGSGFYPNPALPANAQVDDGFLHRLIEAVRLWREAQAAGRPAPILVSVAGKAPVDAKRAFLAEFAGIVGVPASAFDLIATARDTNEEARLIKARVGSDAFYLVTTASHMPRALLLCRRHGLNAVPAPAGHWVKGGARGEGESVLHRLHPGTDGLREAERAVYEYIGLVWTKLGVER